VDRNTQRTDLLTRLGADVEALRSSDRWAQWLRTASKFWHYSLGNQILISVQRPAATRVAGYRRWQELGRQVRRGESAIKILAPVVRKVGEEDGTECHAVVAFKVANVFDIDQTDGDALETVSDAHQAARLATEVADGTLFDRLAALARSLGFAVELTTDEHPLMAGAHGWFCPSEKTITVRDEGIGPATLTLLHELGHALDPDCQVGSEQCRAVGEVVAQSVAFLFGQSLGIALGEVSAVYLAAWDGDTKALEAVAGKVLTITARLEEAMGLLEHPEAVAA
jgi:antirestriction protein ArdC